MGVVLRTRESKKGRVYWLDVNDNGIRRRRTLKIDFGLPEKQRLAIAKIREGEEERALMVDSNEFIHPKSRNFMKYFGEHVAELARRSPGEYRKFLNAHRHFEKVFGKTLLTNQITQKTMEQWKRYLIDNFNGETPNTWWKATMRVINRAVDDKLMKENPGKKIKAPSVPDTVTKEIISDEELARLVQAPMPHRDVCLAWIWCFYTGMVRPELVTLRWSQIDLSRRQVSYYRAKTKVLVVVDLNQTAIDCLPERGKGERVFNLPSDSFCWQVINAWVKAAGIDKHVSWYVARHSFAIRLLEAGVNMEALRQMMGHTTFQWTLRYTKRSDKMKKDAIANLPVLKVK